MDVRAIFIYFSAIMVWYDVSRSSLPQPVASLALSTLYQVRADASYDFRPTWTLPSPFVAIRTLAGKGMLDSSRAESFDLTAGTLLIQPWSTVKRFRCCGNAWHFWWFEFQPLSGLSLPDQLLLRLAVSRREVSELKACFSDLRENGTSFQSRASSRFSLLLHEWAVKWSGEPTPQTRHQAAVQKVVHLMHTRLNTPLALPEMARAAGLGERRFRQVFAQLTGKSPKRFHEELRLRKAADHLRFQAGNVSETADAFGYSSPFHFSKAFRNFFGQPPLRFLRSRQRQ